MPLPPRALHRPPLQPQLPSRSAPAPPPLPPSAGGPTRRRLRGERAPLPGTAGSDGRICRSHARPSAAAAAAAVELVAAAVVVAAAAAAAAAEMQQRRRWLRRRRRRRQLRQPLHVQAPFALKLGWLRAPRSVASRRRPLDEPRRLPPRATAGATCEPTYVCIEFYWVGILQGHTNVLALLKIPVWWRRAVLPSLPWAVRFLSFFLHDTHWARDWRALALTQVHQDEKEFMNASYERKRCIARPPWSRASRTWGAACACRPARGNSQLYINSTVLYFRREFVYFRGTLGPPPRRPH